MIATRYKYTCAWVVDDDGRRYKIDDDARARELGCTTSQGGHRYQVPGSEYRYALQTYVVCVVLGTCVRGRQEGSATSQACECAGCV